MLMALIVLLPPALLFLPSMCLSSRVSSSLLHKPVRMMVADPADAALRAAQEQLRSEQEQRDAHIATVCGAFERAAPALLDGLATQGFAVASDFLPRATVLSLRAESEAIHASGGMSPSMSSQLDETGAVHMYGKHNVLATTLWDSRASPRLVEYTYALMSTLPALLNGRFSDAALSDTLQTNKLAVCLGDGSKYDEHLDTHDGGGDLRTLACLLYLQDEWLEEHGGCLRIFRGADAALEDVPGIRVGRAETMDAELTPIGSGTDAGARPAVDIAPLGGRLVCFWCDSSAHGVRPSYAPTEAGHRWALTVWLLRKHECTSSSGPVVH